ncbi:MAG: hypothetical protein AAGK09_08710 [Planctomycetota bacterium]
MSTRGLRTSYRREAYPGDLGELARRASVSPTSGMPWVSRAGWWALPAAAALALAVGAGWWLTPRTPPIDTPVVSNDLVTDTPTELPIAASATRTASSTTSRLATRPGFALPQRPEFSRRPTTTRGLSAMPTSSLTRAQRQRIVSLSPSSFPSIPSFRSIRSANDDTATPSS